MGGPIEILPSASGRALQQQWARLIKQVYEADPLLCPQGGGPMRIIAFIEQPEVIEEILTHLGLWPAQAHSPPAGYPLPFSLQRFWGRIEELEGRVLRVVTLEDRITVHNAFPDRGFKP